MQTKKIEFQLIGVVRCPVTEMSQGNWANVVSEIHLDPAYAGGLKGLDGFSHILVVFHFHRAGFDIAQNLYRKPRGQDDQPELGVFAQRTKFRPSPIGVAAVPLITIRDNVLTVRALDALDESPVLDIKPYIPQFDRIDGARVPAWVEKFILGYF